MRKMQHCYTQLLTHSLNVQPTPAGQAAEICTCHKFTTTFSKTPSGN